VPDELSLDRQLCFALYTASRAMTAAYRPVLESLGVTYPQYLVLLALWERDGRGVGDLCDALHLDTGTLSPLLKRLEALDLIKRQRLTADERRVEIRLTDKGAGLRGKACDIPHHVARNSGLRVEDLGDLREVLVRLTDSLNASLTKVEK